MIKICSKCGSQLEENAKFCAKCGAIIPTIINSQTTVSGKICSKCGALLSEEMKFCNKCGTPIYGGNNVNHPISKSSYCHNCGSEIKEKVNFCPKCGKPLTEKIFTQNFTSQQNNANKDTLKTFENSQEINSLINDFFTAKGRLNRKPYIIRQIILNVISFIFLALEKADIFLITAITFVVLIASTISSICLSVRRLHDVNKSGWTILLGMIPIINLYVFYLTCLKKGTTGPNHFGNDPL